MSEDEFDPKELEDKGMHLSDTLDDDDETPEVDPETGLPIDEDDEEEEDDDE